MELFIKLKFFLFVIILGIIFVRYFYSFPFARNALSVICGISLAYMTFFVFNLPQWRWTEIKDQAIIKNKKNNESYKFINDNFVLIDNAFDKELLPDPESDKDDSLFISITNRYKIIQLTDLLIKNENLVDKLIIDIDFELSHPIDSLLFKRFSELEKKNKILLSYNGKGINPFSKLNTSTYGSVKERVNSNTFVSHYLFTDSLLSLPYIVYQDMSKSKLIKTAFGNSLCFEKNNLGKSILVANPFFPDFKMIDEKKILDGDILSQNIINTKNESEALFRNSLKLGETITLYGKELFIQDLKLRKKSGRKNYILLGAFTSFDEDLHDTIYGRHHGTVITLNIIDSLRRQQHRVRIWEFFFVLVFFIMISNLIIKKAFEIPIVNFNIPTLNLKLSYRKKRFPFFFLNIIEFFIQIISATLKFIFIDELPYFLLLLFSVIFYLITSKVINILSLIFYFGIFEKSISYSVKLFKK